MIVSFSDTLPMALSLGTIGKTNQEGRIMYKVYMCWNGKKNRHADVYEFDTREELEDAVFNSPFDIIDDNDHDMWLDYGDCDD